MSITGKINVVFTMNDETIRENVWVNSMKGFHVRKC